MDKQQEILDRIIDIEKSLEFVENKFSTKHMFWMGIVKGIGTIVGVIFMIIIGGYLLKIMGVIPGLEEIASVILDAAEKARLR